MTKLNPKNRNLPQRVRLLTAGLVALLAGALPILTLAQTNLAQSMQLQSAIEDVSASVNKFENAGDALQKIFDLTLTEINELASKERLIEATTDTDSDIAGLAQFHLQTLQSHAAYIDLLERQINNQREGEHLKEIAADLKAWRANVYEPHTKEVFDFLLLLQARSVLTTADARLTLVASDVKKIGSRALKADAKNLALYFASAQKNLETARNHQDAAQTELFKLQSHNLSIKEVPVSLSQGVGGSFTCMSTGSFLIPSACTPVFRLNDGHYLLLQPSAELKKTSDLKNIFQASGVLIASIKPYADYDIIAGIEVISVNKADAPVALPDLDTEATEQISAATTGSTETFRKAMKLEFSLVSQTYSKYFLAMSRIAQKY